MFRERDGVCVCVWRVTDSFTSLHAGSREEDMMSC